MAFKQVLEYFVAHLEYVAGGQKEGSRGYEKYIAPLVAASTFTVSGQGHEREPDAIQAQLPEFSYEGKQLCINVQAGYKLTQRGGSYLNWRNEWTKAAAEWNRDMPTIDALYICFPTGFEWNESKQRYDGTAWDLGRPVSLTALGLFDGSDAENAVLKSFLADFYEACAKEIKGKGK